MKPSFPCSPSSLCLALVGLFAISQAAPTLDCRKIASTKHKYPCALQDRKQFAGNTVEVFHYTKNYHGSASEKKAMEIMFETAKNVLPDFNPYIPPLHVQFLLQKDFDKRYGGLTHLSSDGSICYIQIPAKYPQNAQQDDYMIHGNIAHELSHCLEFSFAPEQGYTKVSRWITEGQPEYFADLYYPPRPLPKDDLADWVRKYNPSKPLFAQGEQASLFWHHVSRNGWSDRSMLNYMKDAELGTSPEQERRIMSQDNKLSNAFYNFAEAFVDKKIKYRQGATIPTRIDAKDTVISAVLYDEKPVEYPLVAETFTFRTYSYTVFPGSKISLSYKSKDDKAKLRYREKGKDRWQDLDSAVEVEVGCKDDPIEYEFIFVSTTAKAESKGSFVMKKLAMEDCPCTPNNIPIDPCLVGKWKLNVPLWKKLYVKLMQSLTGGDVEILSINFGGGHSWTMSEAQKSVLDFAHLNIKIKARSQGVTVNTAVDINGNLNSDVVMLKRTGSMCLANSQGNGVVHYTTAGFDFDSPLADGYPEAMYMKYKCSSQALIFSGFYQGGQSWSYQYDRVG